MPDIIFCSFYILLFSAIILWSKWFRAGEFSNKYFLAVFYIKLLFGVALWYIYTHYYKFRGTNDIFKYYDDALLIFHTLHTSAKDYFMMMTGLGDADIHYQAIHNAMYDAYGSTLYNNSHFIIRLNAFFMLFSQGHYGVHVIFMCFISLVGLIYIYKTFIPFLADRGKELFAAVFLFPSALLWSSGILKEGLVWFSLGIILYHFIPLANGKKIQAKNSIAILIGFIVLYEAKAYILICLLPCMVTHWLTKRVTFFSTHRLSTYLLVFILYLGSAFLPHLVLHTKNPLKMIADKQMDFNRICIGGIYLENTKDSNNFAIITVPDSVNLIPLNSRADSLLHERGLRYLGSYPVVNKERAGSPLISFMLRKEAPFSDMTLGHKDTLHRTASDSSAYWVYTYLETANSRVLIEPINPNNILSLFSHMPQAMWLSMLLPYPWQVHTAVIAIYCLENIFVLAVFFIALFFIKRPVLHKDLVLLCFFYSLTMLILIGMVTPVFGGIERYKSVVIPFMFILLLLITKKPQKIKTQNKP